MGHFFLIFFCLVSVFGSTFDKGGLRQKLSPYVSPFVCLWNSLVNSCLLHLTCRHWEVLVKYAGRAFHVTWVQWEFYLFALLMRWVPWLSLLAFLTSHVLHREASTNICWTDECAKEWMLHEVLILVWWLHLVFLFQYSVSRSSLKILLEFPELLWRITKG